MAATFRTAGEIERLLGHLRQLREKRPLPEAPPRRHRVWWDRGVRDGEETLRIVAEEVLRSIIVQLDAGDVELGRHIAVFFGGLFGPSGRTRRPDGRLDETWLDVGAVAGIRDSASDVDDEP